MKVLSNTSEDNLVKLDWNCTRLGNTSDSVRQLHANDFVESDVWQTLALPVTIRNNDANIEFRLMEFVTGITDVSCDYVGVISMAKISTDCIEAYAITAGKIDAGAVTTKKLDAGAVTAEKITLAEIFLVNLTFEGSGNNIRCVSNDGYVQYKGIKYPITTLDWQNATYVYWREGDKDIPFRYNNAKPEWKEGALRQWILAFNFKTDNGKFIELWNATHIAGGQIITDSITATEIKSKALTADQLAVGTITGVELSPSVKELSNLILNPSFEVDTNADGVPDNWSQTGGVTRESSGSYDGTYHMKITKPTAGYNLISSDTYSSGEVKAGAKVVLKFFCRNDIVSGKVRACIHCHKADGTYLNTFWVDYNTTTDWREYTHGLYTLPDLTAKIIIAFENQSTFPAGNIIRVDAVRLESAIKGESIINIVAPKVIFTTPGKETLEVFFADENGVTKILGGKIKTGTVDAEQIKAKAITTDKLTIGLQNLCPDNDFEVGDATKEWYYEGTTGYTVVTSPVHGGTYALRVPSGAGVFNRNHISCMPNQKLLARAWACVATDGTATLKICWYNVNKGFIGSTSVGSTSSLSWTELSGSVTALSTAYYFRAYLEATTAYGYFDDVFVRRQIFTDDIEADAIIDGKIAAGEVHTRHIRFDGIVDQNDENSMGYAAGKMWWRNDIDQLRFSSGTTLPDVAIIPKYPLFDIQAPPENYLPNQAFEIDRDDDGIPDFWEKVILNGTPSFGISSTESYKGGKCAHISLASSGEGKLYSAYIPVIPGKKYFVSTMVKTATGQGGTLLHTPIHAIWYNRDKTTPTETNVGDLVVTDSWTQKSEVIPVPDGKYWMRVALRHYYNASRTLYFDDVIVSEMRAAVPTAGIVANQSMPGYAVETLSATTEDYHSVLNLYPNVDVEEYFVNVFLSLNQDVTTAIDVLVRLYDGTNYYPHQTSNPIVRVVNSGRSNSIFLTIPNNVNGKTITVQVAPKDSNSTSKQFFVGASGWGHSPHTHR